MWKAGMRQRYYYVYILMNNRNTTVYVGVTNSLQKRIFEHKYHLIEGFTKRYNVDKLVYYEQYATLLEAIHREKQVKGWTRKKKENLISQMNPSYCDLFESLY